MTKAKWKIKKVKEKGENKGKKYLSIKSGEDRLKFFKLENGEFQFWFVTDWGSSSGNDYPENKSEINEWIKYYNKEDNTSYNFEFIVPKISKSLLKELDKINPFENF